MFIRIILVWVIFECIIAAATHSNAFIVNTYAGKYIEWKRPNSRIHIGKLSNFGRRLEFHSIKITSTRWIQSAYVRLAGFCCSIQPYPPLLHSAWAAWVVSGHRFIDAFITIVLEFEHLCVNYIWMRAHHWPKYLFIQVLFFPYQNITWFTEHRVRDKYFFIFFGLVWKIFELISFWQHRKHTPKIITISTEGKCFWRYISVDSFTTSIGSSNLALRPNWCAVYLQAKYWHRPWSLQMN